MHAIQPLNNGIYAACLYYFEVSLFCHASTNFNIKNLTEFDLYQNLHLRTQNKLGIFWNSKHLFDEYPTCCTFTGVTVRFFPGQFFPRGKNGPAHSFPGEKTDRSFFPSGKDLTSQFFPHH